MTGSDMTGDFSQLLLGITAGALLAMAAAMLRAPRPAARWTGVPFYIASALFAIKLWSFETQALGIEWRTIIGILAMTSVGWFWLMVMAMFQDRDTFKPWMFGAPAAMMLCGVGNVFGLGPLTPLMWLVTTALQAVLAIWSIVIVMGSWKDDLVESRRRLRGPFMVAVALYMLTLNGFDILEIFGAAPDWYSMANAGMFVIIVMAGALVFLDPRQAMFGSEPSAPHEPIMAPAPQRVRTDAIALAEPNGKANGEAPPNLDRASKADIQRLETLMSRDQVWREEGLTIASLALRSGMTETQLRRLINDCLGYRNFPSYVNAHRIAAAKTRLSDPGEARVSISTIAYDIGFASLGPFNRAFKEEAGVSPSEWRRKSLEIDAPIPEEV